jgi:hypothetical protein
MPWRHMGEWGYSSTFLHLGTSWRWVVSFTPLPFYPRGWTPSTHQIRGWVGPRVGLDAVEKRKILSLPGLESGPFPAIQINIILPHPRQQFTFQSLNLHLGWKECWRRWMRGRRSRSERIYRRNGKIKNKKRRWRRNTSGWGDEESAEQQKEM